MNAVTTVYRCYDATGELLYIGATSDIETRIDAHVRHAFWSPLVADIRTTRYIDRQLAREAEADAIREENPRFNILLRRARASWTDRDFTDVIRAIGERPQTPRTQARIAQLRREQNRRRADLHGVVRPSAQNEIRVRRPAGLSDSEWEQIKYTARRHIQALVDAEGAVA